MTPAYALLLGLLQGLTEFLPVSSSGHLVIVQKLLQFKEPPLDFDVLLHLATVIAIIWIFKQKIINLKKNEIKVLLVGSIPTAIIGGLLSVISNELFNSVQIVSMGLMITTVLLASTVKINLNQKTENEITIWQAIVIGIAQGLAVIPGISRSGITIITGLWLGVSKQNAVTFSFLLSVPAILGAQVLEIATSYHSGNLLNPTYALGFITAFVVGLIAIRWMQRLVIASKLHLFSLYTLILALGILLL